MKINIKGLSVNKCWKGRRFKTDDYKNYEAEVLALISDTSLVDVEEKGPFEVHYKIGLSNKNADLGNIEKPLTDILCKKYDIDDRYIQKFIIEKEFVKKGFEYIEFDILPFVKS